MTPIQEAMCKVIHECGFEGLSKVKVNYITVDRGEIPYEVGDFGYLTFRPGEWTITLDGHTLEQWEYEQWVEQQSSRR